MPGRSQGLEHDPVKIRAFLACANRRMRQGIAELLADTVDMEVMGEAGDAWQAVEGGQMVRPDVLLIDIDLPGLSEPDSTSKITRACPGVSIVVLTSLARIDLMAHVDAGEIAARNVNGDTLAEFLVAIRTLGPGEGLIYPPWYRVRLEEPSRERPLRSSGPTFRAPLLG